MSAIPYHKTQIGEHDYHKKPCYEYCKLGAENCPFVNVNRLTPGTVTRWTDLADKKLKSLKKSFGSNGEDDENGSKATGVSIDFSEKKKDIYDESHDLLYITKLQRSYEIAAGGYTCWGDCSGFEYDIMSQNLMGASGPMDRLYDISNYGISHNILQLSNWNAWIEKCQYDYRYGRVSDMNAECILFPNVDNPWIFTEYIYKGIKGENRTSLEIPDEYVVEPPLYDPDTLELVNADFEVDKPLTDYDGKYASEASGGNGSARVKQYRKIENWGAMTTFSPADLGISEEDAKGKYKEKFDDVNSTVQPPVHDQGVKLYRARIPVQCVKWGEHGNIPPHSLDMTAPENWFDPSAATATIRPVFKAHVGTPLYAAYDGVITWGDVIGPDGAPVPGQQGRQAYINNNVTPIYELVNGKYWYSYTVEKGAGIAMVMPQELKSGEYVVMKPAEKVMGDNGQNEYCHGGCALCYGSNGALKCRFMEENIGTEHYSEAANHYGPACWSFSAVHECPHFAASREHPLIATYQADVMGTDQRSSNMRGYASAGMIMALTGGVSGALMGGTAAALMSNEMDGLATQYRNLNTRMNEVNVTYDLTYEVVKSSADRAKLNKIKYNEYGQGVQIVPGTGRYALDSEQNANPFSGGDTNVYDSVNTLSFHRFFRSVMHCAMQENCNAIKGMSQKTGWDPGLKAGGDGECKYYSEKANDGGPGCPYRCVPKRANEFCKTASQMYFYTNSLAKEYEQMTRYGCWEFLAGEIFKETMAAYSRQTINNRKWCVFRKWAVTQLSDGIALVAVRVDSSAHPDKVSSSIDSSAAYAGAALLADPGNVPTGYAKFCEFKTVKSELEVSLGPWWAGQFKEDGDGNIIYDEHGDPVPWPKKTISTYAVTDMFYWFKPLYNNGSSLTGQLHYDTDSSSGGEDEEDQTYYVNRIPVNLRQHVDSKGYWFCKAEHGFVSPSYNSIIIDNEEKFIGGWHPEYKDYSKIGPEFMQDIVSDLEREGQGMGDYVQGQDYSPIPQPVNKKGYWIDQSGVYITDEREIGYDKPIARSDDRESNSGDAPCISFRKSNTEIDMQTGKKKAPKTLNAAVFANDPYQLLAVDYKAKKWDPETNAEMNDPDLTKKPEFEDPDKDGEKYYAPCQFDPMFLPTMRHAMHCPNCDYYLSFKYRNVDKCPWCGTKLKMILGDSGLGFNETHAKEPYSAEGSTWKSLEGVIMEDKDFTPDVIKKFFKIYSIGNADVWAPPGTAVKTDAYFWRRPPQVSNALKTQIYHRLGKNGSTRDFSGMSPQSEMTLGYPESVGKYEAVPEYVRSKVTGSIDGQESVSFSQMVKTSMETGVDERYTKKYIDWNASDNPSKDGLYNRTMPRHMIPGFYKNLDEGEEDEGVVAPYTKSALDALKMVSLEQMRVMRNAVEPMYAYILDSYSSEFPTYRASYSQREIDNQPIIYKGRRAVISPQVLACTSCTRDSYQTYFSGDLVYGNVKEYFPSGYTWWFMKQLLGGRITENKGGWYHMDDGGRVGGGRMAGGSGGEYAVGTQTVAKCAISIYGMLPLDKEIVAAYVLVSPDGTDPSKNPIGRSWTGGPVMYCHYHAFRKKTVPVYDENGNPTGEYTYHYNDGVDPHLHGTAGYPNDQYFDENGNHVNPHPGQIYIAGADIVPQDEGAYRLWGADSHRIEDDRFLYYEDKFSQMVDGIAGLHDVEFYRNVGTPKKTIYKYNSSSEAIGWGYDAGSFPTPAGFRMYGIASSSKSSMKFQYIVLDDDRDIVVKYPDSEVWKTRTAEQIQSDIDSHTVEMELTVSDGTQDGKVSYTYTESDSTLYGSQVPSDSQSVTGYFDMSWTNTKGYVYGNYNVESGGGTVWDAPVIFQDGEGENVRVLNKSGNGIKYGGIAKDTEQIGTTTRVIPVTDIVKKLYNNRKAANFYCDCGSNPLKVSEWKYYPAAENTANLLSEEERLQNYQIEVRDKVFAIGDFGYPELHGKLDVIPEIPADGDKYEMAPSVDIEFVVNIEKEFYIDETCYAFDTCMENSLNGDITDMFSVNYVGGDTVRGKDLAPVHIIIDDPPPGWESQSHPYPHPFYKKDWLKVVMTEMFQDKAEIKVISDLSVKIILKSDIIIQPVYKRDPVTNQRVHRIDCYSFFGIPTGPFYAKGVQDRIVDVTSYTDSLHHPRMLLVKPYYYEDIYTYGRANDIDGIDSFDRIHKWRYDPGYVGNPQSFVMDLLRAPLLALKQDWRRVRGYVDYSGAKCPNSECLASTMNCSIAAQRKGKNFDGMDNPVCPLCGASLKGQPGVTTVPGDGITTYIYDKPFDENCFVTGVKIMLPTGNEACSCKVMGRLSKGTIWRMLAKVEWSEAEGKYNDAYCVSGGTLELSDGHVMNLSQIKERMRFLKVECESPWYWEKQVWKISEYLGEDEGNTQVTTGGYQMLVEGDFSNFTGPFSIDGLYAVVTLDKEGDGEEVTQSEYDEWKSTVIDNYNQDNNTVKILAAYIMQGNKAMRITLDRYYPDPEKDPGLDPENESSDGATQAPRYLKFIMKRYRIGGIDTLDVMGWHYKTEKGDLTDANNPEAISEINSMYLTITDPEDEYQMPVDAKTSKYKMPCVPTQILGVCIGKGGGTDVALTEANSVQDLRWTTKEEKIVEIVDGINHEYRVQRITAGNYYYDCRDGTIHLPKKNQSDVIWNDFEVATKGTGISKTYFPDTLSIRYWSGNGKNVTVKATAVGHGPSYMVEKNSIQVIDSESKKNFEDNGKTCDMIHPSKGKGRYDIPWTCYNIEPATLPIEDASRSNSTQGTWNYTAGEFRKPNFNGSEIRDKLEDDGAFVDLYGPHCSNCYGKCETNVVFTGAPNKVIQGTIGVTAPAYAEREVVLDSSGNTAIYKERTGGLNNGLLIVKCCPKSTGDGRVTKCVSLPSLLIYARERSMDFKKEGSFDKGKEKSD